jgi:hypothetical protein
LGPGTDLRQALGTQEKGIEIREPRPAAMQKPQRLIPRLLHLCSYNMVSEIKMVSENKTK